MDVVRAPSRGETLSTLPRPIRKLKEKAAKPFLLRMDPNMKLKDNGLDEKDSPEEPLENQPLAWSDEDREIEDRKPDLGEIDEDPSEL